MRSAFIFCVMDNLLLGAAISDIEEPAALDHSEYVFCFHRFISLCSRSLHVDDNSYCVDTVSNNALLLAVCIFFLSLFRINDMDLAVSICDARTALNLFLNNRFEEAIKRMEPWYIINLSLCCKDHKLIL